MIIYKNGSVFILDTTRSLLINDSNVVQLSKQEMSYLESSYNLDRIASSKSNEKLCCSARDNLLAHFNTEVYL